MRVDRMPWCETLRKWVNRTLGWLGYFWPLPLTLNFQGQILSWEWEARLSWNERIELSEPINKDMMLTHWPLGIGGWDIFCKMALRWMSLDLFDDKSTLVQVMAWCCQATSHYLSQCWPRSMSPYGVTRPQWVNSLRPSDAILHQRSMSTLAELITYCLMGLCHYLNQC